MKKTNAMKDILILKKLKAEDPVDLPMDEKFYEQLHDKIMLSVEKTEIKKMSKLAKTWVFLERKTQSPRARIKKAAKPGLAVLMMVLALSLMNNLGATGNSQLLAQDLNQSTILKEAQSRPTEWSELVVNYQNENDFYADVLSRRGLETMVEVDNALSQSL
jgi:hypothetical protein